MKRLWKKITNYWHKLCVDIYLFDLHKWLRRLLFVLSAAVFVTALYFGFDKTYQLGHDRGQRVGQCEVACSVVGIEYGMITDEGDCWCRIMDGNYWYLPLSNKFENSLDK